MSNRTFTTRNKIGLALAMLLGLADLPSLAFQTSDGETGPPTAILALTTVCGVITVVAIVLAWTKANGGAVRIAAGARIVSMLTSLPAFFVDVPAGVKILVSAQVILTLAAVVLMLSPAKQSSPVLD